MISFLSIAAALLLVCALPISTRSGDRITASNKTSFAPPRENIDRLREAIAWVRNLDETALLKLVPEQSGLFFVGCPNCTMGAQENQLAWTPDRPDEVYCRFCGERYPSPKYPMNKALTVRNPLGQIQRYPY